MSGKKMGKLQIGKYMRSKGLTSFDAAFCIPMADSVPAKRQCYHNSKVQHQLDAMGHVRALPSIMAFDAHLDLYNGPNSLHMRRGAAIEFLSTLLQLLPKRRRLLRIAGWNSNCDTRAFWEQVSFIGAFARVQCTPPYALACGCGSFLAEVGSQRSASGEGFNTCQVVRRTMAWTHNCKLGRRRRMSTRSQ